MDSYGNIHLFNSQQSKIKERIKHTFLFELFSRTHISIINMAYFYTKTIKKKVLLYLKVRNEPSLLK